MKSNQPKSITLPRAGSMAWSFTKSFGPAKNLIGASDAGSMDHDISWAAGSSLVGPVAGRGIATGRKLTFDGPGEIAIVTK